MKFDVLTLFPEMFGAVKTSVLKKAEDKDLLEINLVNIRDFSNDKHNKVDDTPYGGGAGMVIRPDVVYDAYLSVKSEKSKLVYLTPQGKTLNQEMVKDLAKEEHLILLCGHYEGIDERVIEEIEPLEISIGDYVLTGGEIPAMVLIDSVSRYVEGVINSESVEEESFSEGLLEYPQYTRPEVFMDKKVPDVLISGHHENIRKWRRQESLKNTYKKRPELFKNIELSKEDKRYIENLEREVKQ
ncbi:MAG: tRNA (guanosine(37)-N1)-methyltransferase TrmD [Clostridia bacterium]|nr:tRNA (guanosine(37)-N1)-methyltransferase TrmD [Clostridia bacterium]